MSRMFARRAGSATPEPASLAASDVASPPAHLRATWIGHATTLLQLGETNVLTDPIFSDRASPFSFTGPRRYLPPALTIEELPPIHAVVVSHAHYDHLDRPTILSLSHTHDPHFFVPLGMARLFKSWGVERVTELDWWQYVDYAGLRIHCTPAKHWSKRSLFDRDTTLWASWMLEDLAQGSMAYFGGDTGYAPHFKEIGARLGSPHIVLLPIGAYEPRWFMKESHINPEEALQAFVDLQGKHFLPVHWSTFELSDEPLEEPGRRLQELAEAQRLTERVHVLPVGGMLETSAER